MKWLEYFRRWARRYDRETESYGYDPRKLLKPFLQDIGHRRRGLDVGCGTGRSLEALEGVCDLLAGVEPVERMARQAEARGFEVLRMRAEDIGRLEKEFDLVAYVSSIDYFDPSQAARACAGVIAPDGVVFLTAELKNEAGAVRAFRGAGFRVVRRERMRAYEGQDYACMLLVPAKG